MRKKLHICGKNCVFAEKTATAFLDTFKIPKNAKIFVRCTNRHLSDYKLKYYMTA